MLVSVETKYESHVLRNVQNVIKLNIKEITVDNSANLVKIITISLIFYKIRNTYKLFTNRNVTSSR